MYISNVGVKELKNTHQVAGSASRLSQSSSGSNRVRICEVNSVGVSPRRVPIKLATAGLSSSRRHIVEPV